MNTEQKIDVLVVMDPVIRDPHSGEPVGVNEDMQAARAAVAELVEAARLVANYRSSGDAVAEAAIKRAQFVRLRAALAKFQS